MQDDILTNLGKYMNFKVIENSGSKIDLKCSKDGTPKFTKMFE